jgi:type IV secretion system protein VirB10
VKGKGEISVRFDSLTLPNGVTRNFRSDLGALDATNGGTLDRENSKIKGPGDKSGDTATVVRTTAEGAAIGTAVGAAAGHIGTGGLIGLAGGATGGLIGVLASRGPEAVLPRGSSVEMVLDRPLIYRPAELDQTGAPARGQSVILAAPAQTKTRSGWPTSPF